MKNIASLLALVLTSCSLENPVAPAAPAPDGLTELSFLATLPDPSPALTRGVGSTTENRVEDIHVLVFGTETGAPLIYKAKARNVAVASDAANANKLTFKATLPVRGPYDYMVLANAQAELAGISVSAGSTHSDVDALVWSLAAGAKWNPATKPIPMWGELKTLTIDTSDNVVFPLTRMLARVNVEYSPAATDAGGFRINSVRVYNYSKRGAIVPTLPAGGYSPQIGTESLVYGGGEQIYLFEAPHNGKTYSNSTAEWIDNPCLVVGGRYSADGAAWSASDTYYRIDFIKRAAGAADEWLSILRNHSYNVSITSVRGEGFRDPETALRSAPFNIEANILPWNDRDMGHIVFDGVFYLSVDRDEFSFGRHAERDPLPDRTNVVRIKTDVLAAGDPTDPASGWSVEKIVDAADQPVAWLRLSPSAKPSGWRPGDTDEAHFGFDTNPGPDNREADVWIRAGRLRYRIHVVQKILSLDLVDPQHGTPVDELEFVLPDGGYNGVDSKQFSVKWTPSSRTVRIDGASPVVYHPFEPGWIAGGTLFPIPDGGEVAIIPAQPSAAVGAETYTVQPPAVSAADLIADPFYERATRYQFTVENNGEELKKSVLLHSIHYALVIDSHKYRLDGGTHAITARSNARWRIADIEEWLYNQPPVAGQQKPVMLNLKPYDNLRVGTTGGPNLSGDALAFSVVSNEAGVHKGKWGTVYVTIESVDGLFPSQRVEIPFPPASRLVLGLGPGLDVRGYNIGIPTSYHLNSAFQMVNSPYNFGEMEQSTCKVDGLRVLGYNFMGAAAATPSATSPDFQWHRGSIKAWLNDLSPDVIVISSNPGEPAIMQADDLRLLREYLTHGGVVILCSHAATDGTAAATRTRAALNALLGTNLVAGDFKFSGVWGRSYQFLPGAASSPMLDGPFSKALGGLAGLNWGAHSYTTGVRTAALPATVVPLSTMKDMSGMDSAAIEAADALLTTAFYDSDPANRFVYIGNGCAMSSYYDSLRGANHTYDPFDVDDNLNPTPALDWGRGSLRGPTYNAHLVANTVAWALEVTNHTPPVGGYQ